MQIQKIFFLVVFCAFYLTNFSSQPIKLKHSQDAIKEWHRKKGSTKHRSPENTISTKFPNKNRPPEYCKNNNGNTKVNMPETQLFRYFLKDPTLYIKDSTQYFCMTIMLPVLVLFFTSFISKTFYLFLVPLCPDRWKKAYFNLEDIPKTGLLGLANNFSNQLNRVYKKLGILLEFIPFFLNLYCTTNSSSEELKKTITAIIHLILDYFGHWFIIMYTLPSFKSTLKFENKTTLENTNITITPSRHEFRFFFFGTKLYGFFRNSPIFKSSPQFPNSGLKFEYSLFPKLWTVYIVLFFFQYFCGYEYGIFYPFIPPLHR